MMTSSEEKRFPFITVIDKAWDSKYQETQVTNKIVNCILSKDHLFEISPWLLECFIMTCLGAYHHTQQPLLKWELRRRLVHWWRVRWSPRIFERDSLILSTRYAAGLLLSLKEYIVFTVDAHTYWKDWFNECCRWNKYTEDVHKTGDIYRSFLASAPVDSRRVLVIAAGSNMYTTIDRFLIRSASVANELTQPRAFWDFARQMIGSSPLHRFVSPTDLIHPQVVSDFWTLRSRLLAYEPTEAEMRYADAKQIHRYHLPVFLLYHRILMIWCVALDMNITETTHLLRFVQNYYSRHRSKPKATSGEFHDFAKRYPKPAELLYTIVALHNEQMSVQVRMLPRDWVNGQIQALYELYPIEKGVHIPRCDHLYYCPSCKDVHSNVTKFRARGSARARRYDPVSTSGYLKIVVDLVSGKLYCGRKQGQTATKCRETELVHFPMIGKWLTLHGHTYTMCGQTGCGSITELDRIGITGKVSYSVTYANDRGIPCARCFDSLTNRSKVKSKRTKNPISKSSATPKRLKLLTAPAYVGPTRLYSQ
jgi:hypothetical protein